MAFLAILCGIFIVLGTIILEESSGLPYVSDNVETYSNHIHARNLHERGVQESLGLTDETYDPGTSSPTVVYTHQGNIPRFYTFLLQALGLDSVRAEIFWTFATVGIATVVLAFVFLLKATQLPFAVVATFAIITNYVFFLQWQFDTFRIWHGFFIFSALLCAHELSARDRPIWRLLLFIVFALTAYFELIFALYSALLCAIYVVATRWPERRVMVRALMPLGLGMAVGGLILIVQVVAYLGWTGFLRDLYFTYFIRNYSNPDYTLQLKLLETFYKANSVVYWYINNQDTTFLMKPQVMIATHMRSVVGLVSPFIVLASLLAIGSWMGVAASRFFGGRKLEKALRNTWFQNRLLPVPVIAPMLVLALAILVPLVACAVQISVLSGRSFPLAQFSFFPLVAVGLSSVWWPQRVGQWFLACDEIEQSSNGSLAIAVRAALLSSAVVLVPIAFMGVLSSTVDKNHAAVAQMAVVAFQGLVYLALLVLTILWIARNAVGRHVRRLARAYRLRRTFVVRKIVEIGSGLTLLGLWGSALSFVLKGGIGTSLAIWLFCIPPAIVVATYQIGIASALGRGRKLFDTLNADAHGFGVRLSLMAWIVAAPLVIFSVAPALVSGRLGIGLAHLILLVGICAAMTASAARLVGSISTETLQRLRAYPRETLPEVRRVLFANLSLFLCAVPVVLLHQSSSLSVFGRYSVAYAGFLTLFFGYGLVLSLACLMAVLPRFGRHPYRGSVLAACKRLMEGGERVGARSSALNATLVALLFGSIAFFLKGAWVFLVIAPAQYGSDVPIAIYALSISVAIGIGVLAMRLSAQGMSRASELPAASVFSASVLLWLLYGMSMKHASIFGPSIVQSWNLLEGPAWVLKLSWALIAIALIPILAVVLRSDRLSTERSAVVLEFRKIEVLLGSSVAAYALVFLISPGYIATAYLSRWALFPAFIWLLTVAFGFLFFLRLKSLLPASLAETAAGSRNGVFKESRLPPQVPLGAGILRIAIAAVKFTSVVIPIAIVGSYLNTQLKLHSLLPATHYSFLPMLAEKPYLGASFVIDNYAGPVVAYTKQWAYYDPMFSGGDVRLTRKGFEVKRDMRHQWARYSDDREKFGKPEYFLCMRPQTAVPDALIRNARRLPFGCRNYPIAIRAMTKTKSIFRNRVVARDKERDSWMILKLDWEYPPYLVQDRKTSRAVRVAANRVPGKPGQIYLTASYEYAHQERRSEFETEIRVYDVGSNISCTEGHYKKSIVTVAKGGRTVKLPEGFHGNVVVSVVPATRLKKGYEYFSEVLKISPGGATKVEKCPFLATPVNFLNPVAALRGNSIGVYWTPIEHATDYLVELRRNNEPWFLAASVKAPATSVHYALEFSDDRYAVRIIPCNGVACGSPSETARALSPDL